MSTSNESHKPNQLINQTSPYLLQHAHNPVYWFPWHQEALELAKKEDRPILLSIGYSACHWCHVMAHESFEDQATADVMNSLYVNIKVDREERPDLDKIYQLAHQVLMRRGGGWPLTVILTPDDHIPFFAGTYFPKESRHKMPRFVDVLQQVSDYYHNKRDEINEQNDSYRHFLQQIDQADQPNNEVLQSIPLDQSRHQLEKIYDGLHGGFGSAPKFPHPTNLERLLRHWWSTKEAGRADHVAKDMAITTLKAMGLGGIYDQLAGGFCRYSVDQEWMIPHFEKMLYDNGPLLSLYSEAWQATDEPLFQRIAQETGEWIMREMQSPEGGYYSSLDADSEGGEGLFYVWNPEQVSALLSEQQYAVFSQRFGLDKIANFEGQWHLHVYQTEQDLAKRHQLSEQQVTETINEAKQILFREREERVRPSRDEKILTAWNGLMIKGMAATGRRFNRPDFIESAINSLRFVQQSIIKQGRLQASYKKGGQNNAAYLDDYAFLLDGILELLQARWNTEHLNFAIDLADTMLAHYEDKERGGFYFTADDHETLIQRPKPYADEAIPAGNGIAAHTLQRLGHILGETKYIDAAEKTLRAAWKQISETPHAHNSLLLTLEEYLYPIEVIVIRGVGSDLSKWQQVCQQQYSPRRLVLAIAEQENELPLALASRQAQGSTVAYWCEGHQCSAPIKDYTELKKRL